jgi:hypothetical protein
VSRLDWKKLSLVDRVVVVAGALALVSMFMPWYGASSGGAGVSVSGFGAGYGWIGAALVVAAGAYLALLRSGERVARASVGPGVLVLGLSALGTALIVIRWLALPSGSVALGGATVFSYGPRAGIFLALVASVSQAVCAFRLFRRSGERLPWEKGSD